MLKYRKIAKEELRKMLEKGDVVLFDVRNYAAYLEKHIKGAKSLPTDVIDREVKTLDKSKPVVVYCTSSTCSLSGYAAEKLSSFGFKVFDFAGGIAEWSEAGFPVESG